MLNEFDTVDRGLIEGAFAWTHSWSGKHPAAMLFGSPVAGGGVGINGDVCEGLGDLEKTALEVAANASHSKTMSHRIEENGKPLEDLTERPGAILRDTPADYFPAYMNPARASLDKCATENAFIAEVWQSQRDCAETAVPFWAGAQLSNVRLGKAFAESLQ